ncbi:MAG: hypothetical protein IPN88_11330 [Bacteroidetes bacterium]|nr:hypothetical protein [Bacteroidota bacterium]
MPDVRNIYLLHVCKSQSAVSYSIGPVSGAKSYIWSITGRAIVAPQGLNANVDTLVPFKYSYNKIKRCCACGTSQPGIYNVNINLSFRTTSSKSTKENGHITAFPNQRRVERYFI